MSTDFDFLPPEQIRTIALSLPLSNIAFLCETNTRFSNIICNDNSFWYQKFVHDFGQPHIRNSRLINWKHAYQNFGIVTVFGGNSHGELGLGDKFDRNTPVRTRMKAKYVACGQLHTIFIDADDNVLTCGWNVFEQLGLGDNQDRSIPTPINMPPAIMADGGAGHTIVIDTNNNVWGFGMNDNGQLGLGDEQERNIPTLMPNFKARFVACGDFYTILVDLNNNVWSCGFNRYGSLGLGDNQNRNIPTQIPNLTAKHISCGQDHTVIIDTNNNVWVFGNNEYAQLGLGDTQNRNVPTQIVDFTAKYVNCGSYDTVLIDMDNNVWIFGWASGTGNNRIHNLPTPIMNPEAPEQPFKARKVASGTGHTILIDMNNDVWVTGSNTAGASLGLGDNTIMMNLGIPIRLSGIKAESVACGMGHTILLSGVVEPFGEHVSMISFNEIVQRMADGEIVTFRILDETYNVPHNSNNVIARFDSRSGNVYLVELQYDSVNNQVLPPV